MAGTNTHKFKKSLPYSSQTGCPSGYHKRKGYTRKNTGTHVPPRCVKSTSVYAESTGEFKQRLANAKTARLERHKVSSGTRKKCPPGQIARKAYVRRFRSNVKQRGYTVKKKTGTTYRVYPKKSYTIVHSACIKDRGLPGKLAPGKIGIAPLREGELRKHGYIYRLPSDQRRVALKKAINEYGALGVYRKLNAVAKLAVRTAPDASKAFAEDRNWIQSKYGPLKAF